ncbi:AAA family ATPase [Bartonella sp. HY761]|uniref:AAA family ATPase n=1 Tax=Bartonella sp. HY761 TaxID=2979330 RepID=UPI0022085581|nr:AAA family ATPase [Bartonella sp. HY761]UXN06456.1 AAA family ATPase [Bartonella sp. HY761]
MMVDLKQTTLLIRQRIKLATEGMIGREQLAELMILGAIAGEHLLVIGPPGTGKSAVVRRVANCFGGRYFEYLLGRFTEPSELFGPVDLRKLKEGKVETDISGMLPEADIAFLDEVFLGSTAILNTLLGILNERRFRRGHTELICPLKICVGASNSLPDDPALAAFADRFLMHLFVDRIADHQLEVMLKGGWQAQSQNAAFERAGDLIATLNAQLPNVDMANMRPILADAIRKLRHGGINLSDRRIVRCQNLIAAAALLNGRFEASKEDLWPLLYVVPTEAEQKFAQDILRPILGDAANFSLHGAVEAVAEQPASRVARLAEMADLCLKAEESDLSAIENILREIDVNFASDAVPQELLGLRARLLERLQEKRHGEV